MPLEDCLTPTEASYIATNAYFTLKDWITGQPTAGVETRANVQNRVLGPGTAGASNPGQANPSLQGTALSGGDLGKIFSGTTGAGTQSGFGYLLQFKQGTRRHIVVATRGTRPELGAPDLLTDARGAMTSFGDFGPVHKGFRKTFDTCMTSIGTDERLIMDADIVHCVGHSLGGAVATLIAAHFSGRGKAVKLYTFGSPRVGAFGTHSAFHKSIGQQNIFRVAHDLDPISLVGPFPYIHTNPSPRDANNFTLPSPTGELFSTANHDMNRYIASVGAGEGGTWNSVRGYAQQTDHDNAVLAKWLLHADNDPGWVQYASAKTLGILFKLFSHVLRGISTSLILGLSAVDLLAEMLLTGMARAQAMASQVYMLLRHAAKWAGIVVSAGADFTAQIIRRILDMMLSKLAQIGTVALAVGSRGLLPLPLIVAGGWALAQARGL
ncbi:MAG: lipase family protein [Burkholderiales bacterium]|nr:lipase family protein [Burkholderiales bacterium]